MKATVCLILVASLVYANAQLNFINDGFRSQMIWQNQHPFLTANRMYLPVQNSLPLRNIQQPPPNVLYGFSSYRDFQPVQNNFLPPQPVPLPAGPNLAVQSIQNTIPQSFPNSPINGFNSLSYPPPPQKSQNNDLPAIPIVGSPLPTIPFVQKFSPSPLPTIPFVQKFSPSPLPTIPFVEAGFNGSPLPSIPVVERLNDSPVPSSPVVSGFNVNSPPPVPTSIVGTTIPNVVVHHNVTHVAMVTSAALKKEEVVDEEWEAYKVKYKKRYATVEEDVQRKQIYYSNKHQIAQLNSVGLGFDLGMNALGDLTLDEFNHQYNGLTLKSKKGNNSAYIPSGFVAKPKLVDWRNYTGAVTSVKDQGNCYSCWAFTAAAVLESHWWRKTGKSIDVSEQNLLDCRNDEEKDSCAPGFYSNAWEYIKDNKGVDGEEIYPYESYDNRNFSCRFQSEGIVARVTGIVELPEKDEKAMELAVATQGPLAAAIDANIFSQQFYADGVFKSLEKDNSGDYLNAKCSEDINHAVTIVGFGEEKDGQKYWLIKNSYGTSWGQQGYMKLARGENMCGISLFPAYPLV